MWTLKFITEALWSSLCLQFTICSYLSDPANPRQGLIHYLMSSPITSPALKFLLCICFQSVEILAWLITFTLLNHIATYRDDNVCSLWQFTTRLPVWLQCALIRPNMQSMCTLENRQSNRTVNDLQDGKDVVCIYLHQRTQKLKKLRSNE